MRKILATDGASADIDVSGIKLQASVEIYDGKTGKAAGTAELYLGRKNIVIYLRDRRRKAGDNRVAFIYPRSALDPSRIIAETGAPLAIKELLRKSQLADHNVTIALDEVVVEI